MALVASLLQTVSGHISAQGVAKNQPAKLAAFEGLYNTTSNAPLVLAGYVDEKNEKVVGIAAPGMLSFLTHNDFHTPVTGLNEFKPEDRPPVHARRSCFSTAWSASVSRSSALAVARVFVFLAKERCTNAGGCCG